MKLALESIASCVLALGLELPARAGVTVTLQGGKERSVVYIEGNKLRVETERGDRPESTMLFDGDQQKMTVIDPGKKTYAEITPQAMKSMIDQQQKLAQEQIAKMTPEQRKQMEQMMSKMDPENRKAIEGMMSGRFDRKPKQEDVKQTNTKWDRTGTKQTVAGFPCEGFKELKDGKLDAEGCYIPWSAGAIVKADLAPIRKMDEFLTQAGTNIPHGRFGNYAQLEQGPGFPGVWAPVSEDGTAQEKQTVTSIKRGSITADKFQLPAGYNKTDFGAH